MSTLNAPVPADPHLTDIEAEPSRRTPVSPKRKGLGGQVWWRHALGILALAWAIFPILFIYSAATNPSGTLNTASLLPSTPAEQFETLAGVLEALNRRRQSL